MTTYYDVSEYPRLREAIWEGCYTNKVKGPPATGRVIAGLLMATRLAEEIDLLKKGLVLEARRQEISWAEIGRALHMSRSGAFQKWDEFVRGAIHR